LCGRNTISKQPEAKDQMIRCCPSIKTWQDIDWKKRALSRRKGKKNVVLEYKRVPRHCNYCLSNVNRNQNNKS